MFFKVFFEQIILNGKKIIKQKQALPSPNHNYDEGAKPLQTADIKSKKLSLLDINENLNTKSELNKAIGEIDTLIKKEGATNQLLLKKADLLLRRNKFNKARQILYKLNKDKGNPKTSILAKELLTLSHDLQRKENVNKKLLLVKDLHKIAEKYGVEFKNLPKNANSDHDFDIIKLVRDQAREARTNDLPMLSHELINRTLQTCAESPWLLLGKALSISMTGQQEQALELLHEIKKNHKGEKLTKSIDENLKKIHRESKRLQLNTKICLAKQSRLAATKNLLEIRFLPEVHHINIETDVKLSCFMEARLALNTKPQASLDLMNSILDYFPGDLAALQLKGEALNALKQGDEAMKIWRDLVHSQNREIASEAAKLITLSLTETTISISSNKTPKSAIMDFIKKHYEYGIPPALNKDLELFIAETLPTNCDLSNLKLKKHQLQTQFNTLVVEYLESNLNRN